tara:strand:- start:1591 stop:1887 length:297 start_codon:yes stop_codon:yes gene_type:complete
MRLEREGHGENSGGYWPPQDLQIVVGAKESSSLLAFKKPNKLPPNTMSSDFATRYKKIEKPVGEGTYGVRSLLALPRCLSFSLSPPAATLSLPQKKEY